MNQNEIETWYVRAFAESNGIDFVDFIPNDLDTVSIIEDELVNTDLETYLKTVADDLY